mmetsp:Transcript_1337/g.3675  ORF Transcript_1337/g.3675 Transcript_1337/m.3675 type:complete len:386 (-) Transcript_1337:141-1298(-)
MSQHKAAMERIHRGHREDKGIDDDKDRIDINKIGDAGESGKCRYVEDFDKHPLLGFLEDGASVLLMPVLPVLWTILFVLTMDRTSLMETGAWAMPLLTVLSATLANAAPVGGGVVFVPILALFGIQIHLGGAAFAVSTMTFGNGVFGFLSWLRTDPDRIAWRVVPYAVLPAWLGAGVGTMRPFLTPDQASRCFGAFALVAAAVVGMALLKGGGDVATAFGGNDGLKVPAYEMSEGEERDDLLDTAGSEERSTPSVRPNHSLVIAQRRKLLASICSFLSGLVLVSHIGVGNALTTFLVGVYIWRLPANSAIVTGILCGGWTSICPFLLHLLVLKDVPIPLWVMGLPGVYAGARIAPAVHDSMGLGRVLSAFAAFLLVTGVVMLFMG